MNPTKKWFIRIAIPFGMICSSTISCSDKLPMTNRFNSKEDLPSVAIENIKTTYTEEGRIKGKLQAQLTEQYEGIVEPYVEFRKGLSIVFYNKENKIETSMTADKAVYYQTKKTWEATGNVIISNLNGDILKTEKLYGDEKEKKIFTDKFVQITKSDGSVIYGKTGFESNTDFTIYKFTDVSGQLFLREEFNSGNDTIANNSENQEKEPFYPNSKSKVPPKHPKIEKPKFK